jgi:hypothetical protein
MGSSRGAMVRVVVELRKGQEIYMLVGQEGNSACVKVFNINDLICKIEMTNFLLVAWTRRQFILFDGQK